LNKYKVLYSHYAEKDLDNLDNSQRIQVLKAIDKVSKNPLSKLEGGYGEPLGNKQGLNLTGLFKIKLLKLGIRIIYRVIKTEERMDIIVIAARSDNYVYNEISKRTWII